jgi:hypothetical protein
VNRECAGIKLPKGYAFVTLPLLMQLVQTRRLLGAPLTSAFTFCRFTFQRRRVTLCACEMLFPNCGPFPQTSHTCAIALLQIWVFRAAALFARTNRRRFGSRICLKRQDLGPASAEVRKGTQILRLAEYPVYPEETARPNPAL